MLPARRAHRAALACATFLVLAAAPAAAQFVPLLDGTPAVQDFHALAASGSAATLPGGWALAEAGSNANATYLADDGATNSGNTYSYGATGSGERAFGMLRSGSLQPTLGAHLRNDSTLVVHAIDIAYTGEQWRLGASGRTDRLDFQYSLDAGSLADGTATWQDVDALDLASPTTTGSVGALDGNAAANRTGVSGRIDGLSLAPGGTLWVRWMDQDIAGAEDGLAIDDITFAIDGEPPVDDPPAVLATIPADGAVGVALDASLVVTFDEPVAVAGAWFAIGCAVSGNHAAGVSGGPTSWTLAPTAPFAADEACTLALHADGITDLDGLPDHPLADAVIGFRTRDPATTPPTVLSIAPADGATHVPPSIQIAVGFSEDVTTAPGAFTLACDDSAIALDETGSGDARTLVPATRLPDGAACVFTVHAGAVTNAWNVPLAADVASAFTIAPGLSGYYGAVNPSDPSQLRCTLHQVIRGHTAYPYSGAGTSTWTILETAQADAARPGKIIDVYRNRRYDAVADRAGTGSGITYNREHTWPNSLGFPSATGNLGLPNAPYTDTHMLWLSDTQYNADRGNKPFAYCNAACGERVTEANGGSGGGSGSYPGNSNWVRSPDGNQGTFEAWGERKGEMARAIFYMAIRYEGGVDPTSGQDEPELELTDIRSQIVQSNNYAQTAYMGLLADLLAWHQADPPDAAEVTRNDVIQGFQGNRNPFVDHPEWATRALFESTSPVVCEPLDIDAIFADGFE